MNLDTLVIALLAAAICAVPVLFVAWALGGLPL